DQVTDRSFQAGRIAGLDATEERLDREHMQGAGVTRVAPDGERLGREARRVVESTGEDRQGGAMDRRVPEPLGKTGALGVMSHALDLVRRLGHAAQLEEGERA